MDKRLVISFLGDVACDRPMLRAARDVSGEYSFDRSLSGISPLLSGSDYVVGNLETVCAGRERGYNPGAVTYNTPDAFIPALKRAGINVLTTANNHCLDCGLEGLRRTIQMLDENGIAHTGTYVTPSAPDQDRILWLKKNGVRVAIVAVTACMNGRSDGQPLSKEEWNSVNQLKELRQPVIHPAKRAVKRLLPTRFISEMKAAVKRRLGIKLVRVRVDDEAIDDRDLERIQKTIDILDLARESADVVIACVHSGGQFNAEPGRYTKELFGILTQHADVIIGNHPHVVQRMVKTQEDRLIMYSLGSLNMSPSGDYVDHQYQPSYSMLLELELKKTAEGMRKTLKYHVLYAREDADGYLSVQEADPLDPCARIVENRFLGKGD